LWTKTSNVVEHAEGKYNKTNTGKTIHSIGIGTSDTNRLNAVEVTNTGDVYIKGIGDYSGTTLNGASTLQTVVGGI
jgi:hypothetical protein